MVELSLFEKIKTLFSLIFSSPLFLILLIGVIIIFIDIFYISKKSKKVKIIYLILSIIIIFILLYSYLEQLLNIIDIINKNIVNIINFPSLLEYIVINIISLLIMLFSLIKKNTNKIVKRINIGVIISDIFIFFLILDQISKNNIDLSSKVDIYINQNLMVLFQINMFIFIIWIIGLIIFKICKHLIKEEEIELPKKKIENLYEEPEMPKTIEELRKEVKIDNVFTIEEYKEIKKILEEINKK